jgi:exopolyphosphatase/pppGpp-phosphohydrolase
MFGMNKSDAQNQVNELAERLKSEAGLTDEQAQKTLEAIKNFVVEKYPMLQGAVSSMFGS